MTAPTLLGRPEVDANDLLAFRHGDPPFDAPIETQESGTDFFDVDLSMPGDEWPG
jgi:hypothetical protein